MYKWLTDNKVLGFYEGRDFKCSLDSLSETYNKQIPHGFRMIIEYHNIPIGYAQAYQVLDEMFDEYDYQDNSKIVYAMDQFIGEVDYWNKGIGTSFLELMSNYLKKRYNAERLLLDPHISNKRAAN